MSEDWSRKVGRGIVKGIAYLMVLAAALSIASITFAFGGLAEAYKAYLPYVQAALVLLGGYKAVGSFGQVAYYSVRKYADHSTAAAARTIIKIAGVAVLLSLLTSIFGISASSALTVGSFSGLVVGFATQTVLTHAVAGIFIAVSRPFRVGDTVTIAGKTGVVKEIRLMHTTLASQEGNQEILIPSGKIIGEIIVKSSSAGKS